MESCPYCNSVNLTARDLSEGALEVPVAYISCSDCKGLGPSARYGQAAWDKWNARPAREEKRYDNLKSCMFCKNLDTKIKVAGQGYYVECQKCKASGPTEETPFAASEKWNRT